MFASDCLKINNKSGFRLANKFLSATFSNSSQQKIPKLEPMNLPRFPSFSLANRCIYIQTKFTYYLLTLGERAPKGKSIVPPWTQHKLNVYRSLRKCIENLWNVLCMFILCPMFRGLCVGSEGCCGIPFSFSNQIGAIEKARLSRRGWLIKKCQKVTQMGGVAAKKVMSLTQNFSVPPFFLDFLNFFYSISHEALITIQEATVKPHPRSYLRV